MKEKPSSWTKSLNSTRQHPHKSGGRWQQLASRIGRQLVPNLGTIVVVILLLWANSAGAAPWNDTAAAPTWPSTTTINYQGRLTDSGGVPLDGYYDMHFALYDSDADGTLLWGPEDQLAVPVSDGLFSVDLGGQTDGGIPNSVLAGDIWLEITVAGETLSPRERLGAVPYAMQASTALTVPDDSITAEKIAAGAITQEKAPTLVQSANGQNEIIRSGNNVFDGTDQDGFIEVTYPCGSLVVRGERITAGTKIRGKVQW